jgi:hypothetical protein
MTAAPTLRPCDVVSVALTLGGSVFVSRAALAAGDPGLRVYTKAGKPRNRRGSSLPMGTGRALIHPAYTPEPVT